jgi:asparagine synthase (glutamine-hydrolysing)
MHSADGLRTIIFNGEIYNYKELREQLAKGGEQLRSTSDTEVLLRLYEKEGEAMLGKLRGMFAFAIWDAKLDRLFFARDRIGKKPFFYTLDDRHFRFASELPALFVEGKPMVDWNAVRLFLGLQYVPSPLTGFQGVSSLPPAHCGVVERGRLTVRAYDPSFAMRHSTFDGSEEDAAKEVRRLLEEAVRYRLIADVPVGVFLSGGVDSTAIATIATRVSAKPLQSFTMGFPSLGFDEREEARATAKRLGTEHHEFVAEATAAAETVDRLVELYAAPYADSSALPTWLLARETRTHVKAVLSGDGGDELFGGYRRYQAFAAAARLKRFGLAWAGTNVAWTAWMIRRDPRWRRFAETLEGIRRSYGRGYADLFCGSYFGRDDLRSLVTDDFLRRTDQADAGAFIVANYAEELGVAGALDFDLRSYLPDDLNVKMDRATMAHGLEARAPFLDQELVKFAARLPLPFLMKRGIQKPLLRRALSGLVPADVFDRPKRGFQVPLANWFRDELKTLFMERCLSERSPLSVVCRPEAVERLWKENDRGVDHGNRLWMLLTLATWLDRHR